MARKKSINDIVNQQKKLLLALGDRNGQYDPTKNARRQAFVSNAAIKYIDRINGMKSTKNLLDKAQKASDEAWDSPNGDFSKADRYSSKADSRKFSSRTYMGLSNG